MRPPKNLIIEDLYTSGNELLTNPAYENYVGYYHKVSSKPFMGAKYNPKAIELTLYTKDKIVAAYNIYNLDSTYAKLNPKSLNLIKQDEFPIVRSSYIEGEGNKWRYFIKRNNEKESPIIEVNNTTYNSARINPFWQTTTIYWVLNQAFSLDVNKYENELPGIMTYLGLS
jgi:hypothetical protein